MGVDLNQLWQQKTPRTQDDAASLLAWNTTYLFDPNPPPFSPYNIAAAKYDDGTPSTLQVKDERWALDGRRIQLLSNGTYKDLTK